MSPVGGVGINLAIQDAVAASNILSAGGSLQEIQKRRERPVRVTQRLQILMQDRVITPLLSGRKALQPPLFLRLAHRFPILRRLPGRLIGMGVRPERPDR
jgi:2-polyprenyl-6-methoxyphenol hydroxylase-like FAD-dependent oxidoreductase